MSISILSVVSSLLTMFKWNIWEGLIFGVIGLSYSLVGWTTEVKVEGMLGFHTPWVSSALKYSFCVFLFTEVMFFVSFFWAFFDASLVPSIEGGATWPPFGIKTINPFGIPLLNTMLLVFSSVLLTWAHKEFFRGKNITWKLWGTLLMGVAFMYLQFVEYQNSKFTISSGVYGSVFYLLTGLHGCHVFLGGVFIFIFIIGYEAGTYSRVQHIWLELASVYWHFVDVVWLFVWVFLYLWGS